MMLSLFKFPKPRPQLLILLQNFFSSSSSPLRVAVLWDLVTSKPPNLLPSYDASVRLRLAAASFGRLRLLAAAVDHHSLRLGHHPQTPPTSPFICRLCSRRFLHRPSLLHHFTNTHRPDHLKRLNRLNSARGPRRAHLAATLSPKIHSFNKAAAELAAAPLPGDSYSLADELKRAGVSVVKRFDDIEGLIDRGRIGCLVLVSDDCGLLGVLREARLKGLMTVVIGDRMDGKLKRGADAGYSWRDVVCGKVRKQAEMAVRRWKDKGLLKGLEWRYEGEDDGEWDGFDGESDGSESLNLVKDEGDVMPWWKLDLDRQVPVVRSSQCR